MICDHYLCQKERERVSFDDKGNEGGDSDDDNEEEEGNE